MSSEGRAVATAAIRQRNAAAVLQALWETGAMSRTDLADRIGVTRPAITRIIQELVAAGFLDITAGATTEGGRGRPGDAVQLSAGRHLCIGADLRLDRARMRGVDLRGAVLFDEAVSVRSDSPAVFIADITSLALELAQDHGLPVAAVGVSGPIIVSDDGRRVTWPMRNWQSEPVADPLARALGLAPSRVQIGNISGCAALANWRELATAEVSSLAHLQVGLGAGLGIADRSAHPAVTTHHIEHLPLMPGGPLCHCGVYGCVYAMVGFETVAQIARPGFTASPGLDLYAVSADIGRQAAAGDLAAEAAIEYAALWLGQLAGIVHTIFSPTMFTMGGYPQFLGDVFGDSFRQHFRRAVGGDIQLQSTTWGDEAATQGVALLAVRGLLDNPRPEETLSS